MISLSQNEAHLASEPELTSPAMNTAASASLVNRTHRVVRERARTLEEHKSRARSLWIPLTVSFGMLALLLSAVWSLLDESEFFPDGIPDSAQQMLVLSMWCIPLSVAVLAVVWSRRLGAKAGNGSPR